MSRDTIGPFEADVLGSLLTQPADAYGLTIRDRLAQSLGKAVSLGSVYTTLERLERKGFIASWWVEGSAERGGRRKRLYKIEPSGREAVERFTARFSAPAWTWGGAA